MKKQISHARRGKDYASEELVTALLEQRAYTFNELFQIVFARLKERKVSSVGEDMVRLRVYERLQTFVGKGLVRKVDREYSAAPAARESLAANLETMRALKPHARREVLAA